MLDNDFPPHLALDPRYRPARIGRPKRASGVVGPSQPGLIPSTLSTVSLTLNTSWYQPLWFPEPTEIDALYFEPTTTSAGALAYGGLYQGDADWQPVGPPLAIADSLSLTAAAVKATTFTPIVVQGLLLARLNATATVSWRATRCTLPNGFVGTNDATLGTSPYLAAMSVAETAGTAPSPGTLWTTAGSANTPFNCFAWVRVSDPDPPGW